MFIPIINRVSFLDKVLFAKHLALMIKAGLPLRESVDTLREQAQNKRFKKVLDDVIKSIDNGQSLAVSLSRHSRLFDPLYINMIRLGEESGTLEENLGHLASQLEKSYELRRNVKAAMLYPLIILCLVIVLSAGLSLFVLPKITPIFKTFDIQLPLATRLLIKFSDILQHYGIFLLIGVAGFLAFLFLIFRIRVIRFLFHKIVLKLPIIGRISQNVNLAHFSRTLGTLLKSGLPVISALDTTQATLGNLVYQKELEGLSTEVKKGKSISDYLKKREAIFPSMVFRMIGVGEKTGSLEETLLYLGNFYETEVEISLKSLSTILEPILLIIIGLAVGFVALAIISPIYEITRGLQI